MKKIFTKEVVIGLCVLGALAFLIFGINYLKGVNLLKAANYYYASYTNVEGLSVSAPVKINGFKVGQVRSIEYEYDNPGHVLVEMSLDRNLVVPSGTKAVLEPDLLGTATITLEMSDASDNHAIGDRLIGVNSPGMIDAITGKMVPSVEAIMPKIDQLLTNINAIVGDSSLQASVKRLDAITSSLQATTRNLAAATSKLVPITNDVKDITANVTNMTADLSQVSAKVNNMPLEQIMADVQATTDNLRQLTTQLGDPNSTLGKLSNDPALYNNVNTAVLSLDSLLTDIKQNPKRYISIKVF